MHRGILPSLVQELESLGVSINHIDHLNDNRELYHLADNIKQEFMNEIREMEEQGFFVNLGGG
jgi:predicted glycosyltransferase involved in capsule biosynthesis